MNSRVLFLAAVAALSGPGVAHAKCAKSKDVFVRAKTPVRKGPGLNYSVASFLEEGRCGGLEQVSLDGRWALLRFGSEFGWVFTERLSAKGQERARRTKASSAPIGSGVSRSFARVTTPSVLRERPQAGARPRRVLPEGTRLLPLKLTPDGLWAEVRDDRGDIGWIQREDLSGEAIDQLPLQRPDLSEAVTTRVKGPDMSSVRAHRRMGAQANGVHLTTSVFAGLWVPMQRLDSDGVRGLRRYDLSAVAAGLGIELQLSDLGPITARGGFSYGAISGISSEDTPDQEAGGSTSALVLRAGWPLAIGTAVITPEVGYAFDSTTLDVALPGSADATFVSSDTHMGLAGARLQVPLMPELLIEGDLALGIGGTSASPGTLGASGGLAVGGRASVGAQLLFDAAFGLVVRYLVDGFTTSYSGTGTLDGTITEATLGELRQQLVLGASYSL